MHSLLLSWFLSVVATPACEDPTLAALTPPAPPADSLEPQPYERLRAYETGLNLGRGRLHPVDMFAWDWQVHIRLPLFHTPGESPIGWILEGWVVDAEGTVRAPLGTTGMIETDYEVPSFIVLDARADGWVRFRYRPGSDDEGSAWTHSCFFDATEGITLAVDPWEDRFLSGEISPLYFRAEERHSLRAGPSIETERLLWIPADQGAYNVEPIEVRGDWMRVKVTIPSTYCGEDIEATETEGWVKWRDDEVGPWVWYYTRGC